MRTIPILVASILLCGAASADVIGPPPARCPSGSVPASSHIGPFCHPPRCTGSSRCEVVVGLFGQKLSGTCEERKLCVVTVTQQGGWASGHKVETVVDACDAGTCAKGTCERLRVCVADVGRPSPKPIVPASAPVASGRKGCGCSVGAPADSGAAVIVLLLGVLLRRRRR
jgi:MYXO-CTERM domain-containing protein